MAKKSLVCWLILHLFFCCHAQELDSIVTAAVEKAENLRLQEGDNAGAIAILLQTVGDLQKQGVKDNLAILPLYHKLGVTYYLFGKYLEAEKYTNKALVIREQAFGKIHLDVAKGYYLRAILNKELQLYGQAEKDLEEAISSMETLLETGVSQDTFRLIWMFEESIRLHMILRNNALALQFWDRSYNYYVQNEGANFKDIIALYNYKGHIHYNQQNFDLSDEAFKKAIAIFEQYGQPSQLRETIATIYSDWGVIQFKQDKYQEARTKYQIAQRSFEQILGENESPRLYQKLGIVHANLLELSGKIEDYEQVNFHFDQAHKYYLEAFGTIYHPNLATLYRDRATIDIAQKKVMTALAYNQKAVQALIPDFTAEDHLELVNLSEFVIQDKISFLETLHQRAQLLKILGQKKNQDIKYLESAFQNYRTLDTVITQIRQSYNAAGSQFDLIEQSYPIYEQAINVAISLAQQSQEFQYLEAAYYFAARNKALVLLGSIQEQQAQTYSSIPESLKEKERSIKKSTFQLESELYELGGKENSKSLKDSLFALKRSYQKLINQFETNFPDYYDAKYGFDNGVKIAALQKNLLKGTAVIEYFVGEEQLFAFIITKDGFDYHSLTKPKEFEQLAWSFREQIQVQQYLSDELSHQSHQLYQWLLAAILSKSIIKTDINHLAIIPDGVLIQLPFDVLITDAKASPTSYLLRQYAISYAYSNRLLFGEKNQRKTTGIFAGFGLEYDDYTLADLTSYVDNRKADISLSRALGKLQYSDDEVIEIAALLSGNKWVNEEATRTSFLENADQYAILHLAMHGVLNEKYPMNSALIFSRQNDSSEYFLRAADLYNMNLNADMTVLSACNTGAGALQKGEGVRSLARAFSYAGCPSLVASLWNASDKSTKDILLLFYQNLQDGMSKHEAIRQAKLAYLENAPPAYQAPYYWSHLSVIGDSSALRVLSSSFLKRYGVQISIILIILIGLFYFYQKRNAATS